MADIWPLVHAERRALVADLARLSAEQWETASLAKGWTVHDVAAHLVDNARTTPFALLRGMVASAIAYQARTKDAFGGAKILMLLTGRGPREGSLGGPGLALA